MRHISSIYAACSRDGSCLNCLINSVCTDVRRYYSTHPWRLLSIKLFSFPLEQKTSSSLLSLPICDAKQRNPKIATQCVTPHRQCHGIIPEAKAGCASEFSIAYRRQKGTHRRRASARSRTRTQLARPSNRLALACPGTPAFQKITSFALALAILAMAGCSSTKTYTPAEVAPPPVHHYQISVAQATNMDFLKSLSWPASIEITNWDLLTQ